MTTSREARHALRDLVEKEIGEIKPNILPPIYNYMREYAKIKNKLILKQLHEMDGKIEFYKTKHKENKKQTQPKPKKIVKKPKDDKPFFNSDFIN